MTRQKKELVKKIEEIDRIIAAEEEMGLWIHSSRLVQTFRRTDLQVTRAAG